MRDVAALAGVSLKTVSRVVNGESGVSTDLVERVNRAAGQLAYQHNLGASNLRRTGGKTATLGLLVEDIANPFSAAIFRAVEDTARARGVAVFAASVDEDPGQERDLVSTFSSRRVDGLIMVPSSPDQSYLSGQATAGMAVVFIDRPAAGSAIDAVVSDNREGARAGVTHLLSFGHERIAFIGDLPEIATAELRYLGYTDALHAAGLALNPSYVHRGVHTSEDAELVVRALLALDTPPTAIFSAQNLITIGVVRGLHAADAQHHIAVVGFDDFSMADMVDPGITVLAQDAHRIGELATEVIFTRIDGDDAPAAVHTVGTTLIARGSGEISPVS